MYVYSFHQKYGIDCIACVSYICCDSQRKDKNEASNRPFSTSSYLSLLAHTGLQHLKRTKHIIGINIADQTENIFSFKKQETQQTNKTSNSKK